MTDSPKAKAPYVEPDTGYPRLEQQLEWYDRKARSAQGWSQRTKMLSMSMSALVPIAAFLSEEKSVVALLGVAVVMLEGLQQVNGWHDRWTNYRAVCENLRREKFAYLGGVGSYDGLTPEEAKKALILQTENIIATENVNWMSRQQQNAQVKVNAPAVPDKD